jgi:hypothetical protein
MTLVEMLVAMALTLLMMAAVAQIFGMLGQGVNGSRSMAELNDRMRATAYRLRQDLAGVTVDTTPPVKPELNSGYLEIIEGPCSDLVYSYDPKGGASFDKSNGAPDAKGVWQGNPEPYLTNIGSDDRIVGDVDDIILFTTRSPGELFSGKADSRNGGLEGGGFRSPYAEVVWFCKPAINSFNPRTYTLHRRQRLIAAHPGAEPFVNTSKSGAAANMAGGPPNTLPFEDWPTLHAMTDISCRRQGNLAIPNCLGDLTRRENRFLPARLSEGQCGSDVRRHIASLRRRRPAHQRDRLRHPCLGSRRADSDSCHGRRRQRHKGGRGSGGSRLRAHEPESERQRGRCVCGPRQRTLQWLHSWRPVQSDVRALHQAAKPRDPRPADVLHMVDPLRSDGDPAGSPVFHITRGDRDPHPLLRTVEPPGATDHHPPRLRAVDQWRQDIAPERHSRKLDIATVSTDNPCGASRRDVASSHRF